MFPAGDARRAERGLSVVVSPRLLSPAPPRTTLILAPSLGPRMLDGWRRPLDAIGGLIPYGGEQRTDGRGIQLTLGEGQDGRGRPYRVPAGASRAFHGSPVGLMGRVVAGVRGLKRDQTREHGVREGARFGPATPNRVGAFSKIRRTPSFGCAVGPRLDARGTRLRGRAIGCAVWEMGARGARGCAENGCAGCRSDARPQNRMRGGCARNPSLSRSRTLRFWRGV